MKILIVRFSSFGDVLQTLSVAGRIGRDWPQAEIHWVTRQEFVPLIEEHPHVQRVWSLKKGQGFRALWRLAWQLKRENFTHVYDAHNNLRSHVLSFVLRLGGVRFLRRSIYRWRRFLLFRFHRNLFPKPFSGQFALLEPLKKWGLSTQAPPVPQLFLPEAKSQRGNFVALAPSAAFELKRWPINYWQELIDLLPEIRFVVLGGPEDQFLKALEIPGRVQVMAGQLSLIESAEVIAQSQALVSNDTGLMHVAEQIGKPCLALMGPAPFGFPSRPTTEVFEMELKCRPCSKHGQGPCVNPQYQLCLRGIPPARVAQSLRRITRAAMVTPLPQP